MGRRLAGALLVVLTFGVASVAQHPGGMPRGEKHESRHEIDQMEELWRDAVLKGDTAKMASLLADDYMAISPSGTLQNKEQSLASLSSGRMHFSSLELSDRKVRFYGTTALVTSLAMVVGNTPEGDLVGSFRYTRVYVRDAKGTWKVVSFEASRVRPAGQHRPR
jgi:ketosteroid isomerase-like protein